MHIKTQGLVLREVNYKEADKILTVLTPEGKLTVAGRGARRKGSRVAGACRLFAFSELVLFENRGRYSLEEAEPLRLFDTLAAELDRFALAAYLMELLECVTNENEDGAATLSLALNSLYMLEEGKAPALVKPVFELRLMALAGFEPLLDGCAVCGLTEPEQPRFNISQGVLHCAACRGGVGDGISMPLTPGALAAMRHIMTSERPFSFRLSDEGLALLGNATEAFVLAQLERSFRTLDFYKSLLTNMEIHHE